MLSNIPTRVSDKNLTLRRFLPKDLDQVLQIKRQMFPLCRRALYFEKLAQKEPEGFIVAELKTQVVGYAVGRQKNNSGKIISMAVVPHCQRKGVGRALADCLLNYFKKIGLKKVFLHVRTKNQAALSFYLGLGFTTIKTIAHYYSNGDNAYLMEKRFRAHSSAIERPPYTREVSGLNPDAPTK